MQRPVGVRDAAAGGARAGRAVFPDHHRYDAADIRDLNGRARASKTDLFITTEKDLARLSGDAPFLLPVAALVTDLVVTGDDNLVGMILEKVREKAR